jgi:hypothetical protein
MGDKVGYFIVKEEHTIKKRILTQNTVFSAEQSAIFEKNNRHEIVIIITDSRSTTMAAETLRRGFQKERPKMEKRKKQDEREEAGRRQKGGYERNAKERASGNIQTQNQV